MIFDNIKNAPVYFCLDDKIKTGLKFIMENDLSSFDIGKYEIIPDKVYASIQEYNTKSEGKYEAHKKYIDIQYMIKGSEKMGICELSELRAQTEYDEEKDVQFFDGNGNLIEVPEGYFTIFYPQDGHMPCIQNKKSDLIKKVVIKILI